MVHVAAACDVPKVLPYVPVRVTADGLWGGAPCSPTDQCLDGVAVAGGHFQLFGDGPVSITVTGGSPDSRPHVTITYPENTLVEDLAVSQGAAPNSTVLHFRPIVEGEPIFSYSICDCSGRIDGPYEIAFFQSAF